MKIDVISDLHIDTFFYSPYPKFKKHPIFSELFEKATGEVLVVAGDLGHKDTQNLSFLKFVSQLYSHVIVVPGNHDLYLIKKLHRYKTSLKRYNNFKWHVKEKLPSNISILDGRLKKIKGVVFGGTKGFYDGTYLLKNFPQEFKTGEDIQRFWNSVGRDRHHLVGLGDVVDYAKKQRDVVERLARKCDIMVTHYPPFIRDDFFAPPFRGARKNGLFSFDGEEIIRCNPIKYWIYGHTHTPSRLHLYGTSLIANPLGRVDEVKKRGTTPLLTIEVNF